MDRPSPVLRSGTAVVTRHPSPSLFAICPLRESAVRSPLPSLPCQSYPQAISRGSRFRLILFIQEFKIPCRIDLKIQRLALFIVKDLGTPMRNPGKRLG